MLNAFLGISESEMWLLASRAAEVGSGAGGGFHGGATVSEVK